MAPTVRTRWSVPPMTSTFRVSRSVTTASPPGRNAMPHGTARPVATVPTPRGGVVWGEGRFEPVGLEGPPVRDGAVAVLVTGPAGDAPAPASSPVPLPSQPA